MLRRRGWSLIRRKKFEHFAHKSLLNLIDMALLLIGFILGLADVNVHAYEGPLKETCLLYLGMHLFP
jgi:hypothetical protein